MTDLWRLSATDLAGRIRGKQISGYCNVNGKGKITEFKQGI
jgi:hypothetical protein